MQEMRTIQWFPGHMAKTRRLIQDNLSLVDAVVEILDARIPDASRNPEMNRLVKGKPRMFLLNKSDMADDKATAEWIKYYKSQGIVAMAVDCKSGKGVGSFLTVLKQQVLADLIKKRNEKGMTGHPVRVMVVGIPNVGKSSFINRMSKSKRTKVEDRPGVTRTKQWVKLGDGVEMLDMPGVVAPKFEDQSVAMKLAYTGAINDDILDIEALAMNLLEVIGKKYPESLKQRYKIDIEPEDDGKILLEKAGRKRGMLISGGEINTERIAITVLDEYRSGKLGKITLELAGESSEK